MISPHDVIVAALRFDHDPTGNAKRILGNLREEGYIVIPRAGSLPEIQRMYGAVVSSEHAVSLMQDSYEQGIRDAA